MKGIFRGGLYGGLMVIILLALPTSYATAGSPIELGGAVSLTGSFAKLGQEVKAGYELWMEKVNARGGLTVGGIKRPVKLSLYDDQSNANLATKLVEKLISQDNIKLILGPYSSGISLAVSVITEKNRALLMAAGGNANELFERDFQYIFGVWPLATEPIKSTLSVIHKASPGYKTVGIAVKDNLFTLTAASGARAKAKELGLQIVFDEKFPADINDFSVVIGKAKAANPDIMIELGHFEPALLFIKQSRELGFSPKAWTTQPGPETPDFRKALGPDANYVFWYALWSSVAPYKDPVFESNGQYAKDYESRFKVPPSFNSSAASAGAELIGLAIEKAASTEPDKVRDALRALKIETIMGPVEFDKRGLNIHAPDNVVVYQIQDGRDVLLAPEKIAQGKPKLPMPVWSQR